MEALTAEEFGAWVKSIFPNPGRDQKLALLVDIPWTQAEDNSDWKARRQLASDWHDMLSSQKSALGLKAVSLFCYPSVGSNNADLPPIMYQVNAGKTVPHDNQTLNDVEDKISTESVFSSNNLFLAPTEFSTTAPLKNAAATFKFRAATLPGFNLKMLPALRIDVKEVSRRVHLIKEKVDEAQGARIVFDTGKHGIHELYLDLRHRKGHVSSGQITQSGTAGNAPSGETYIVPYEGEKPGIPTLSKGILPVQEAGQLLFFKIENNRAIAVSSPETGTALQKEQDHLTREPAYGNMAELGFGVLGDFGLEPIDEILLDEKLGLHIAFGRSDHFGGMVGPSDFSSPAAVIHLDRIYISQCQPKIEISHLELVYADDRRESIIQNGTYLIFA